MARAKKSDLESLVGEMADALREHDRLLFDEEYPHELGPPCSPQQLAILERALGKPLPPSYREFLELHNGWDRFVGDAKILAVEDHGSEWVQEKLLALATLFADFGENPFDHGALPVMLGQDAPTFLTVDPRTTRPNGEMDFVAYHICHEEARFDDFIAFLRSKLKSRRRSIEREKKGVESEDEES